MDDLAIIDRFTETFSRYIDSGFGLLAGDVAFLTTVLVAIDITLAGLFWAMHGDENVPVQLIRKVLYVGFFALLLNNFKGLADIVFQSFAGLGLKASGTAMTAADLMRPGFVASAGFAASRPLLEKAGELIGITTFFSNFVTIAVLLLAWVIVLLAFFVLAVQLFIAIIEFKLTTLAGFVLVPFALFGQTAFLAERVLGNVISSGIKLMVLAIVVGIGSSIFGTLVRPTADITLTQAASTILAAIAVFGLAIFVPGIAAGLITGAPQLGAGAAVATTAARRRHGRGRRHAHLRGRAPGRPRLGRRHQGRRVADRHRRRRLPGRRAARRRPRHGHRSRLARRRLGHGTRPRRLSRGRGAGLSRRRTVLRPRSRTARRRPRRRRSRRIAARMGAAPGPPPAHDPGRPDRRRRACARATVPRSRPAPTSRTRAEELTPWPSSARPCATARRPSR